MGGYFFRVFICEAPDRLDGVLFLLHRIGQGIQAGSFHTTNLAFSVAISPKSGAKKNKNKLASQLKLTLMYSYMMHNLPSTTIYISCTSTPRSTTPSMMHYSRGEYYVLFYILCWEEVRLPNYIRVEVTI